MARTEVRSAQVKEIGRSDLDTTTAGNAVATKLVSGARVAVSGTGADTGTGDVTLDLKEHYYSALFTQSGTGIDWANGNAQKRTLTADITFTMTGGVAGGRYLLEITQSGGAWVITWPSTVKWPAGTTPTPSASGKVDIYTFFYDGTNYYAAASLNYTP
jgi:hypothetical protein